MPDHEGAVDEAFIQERARFVTEIGHKLKPLVEAVESLEGSKAGVLRSRGPIEIEMQEQPAKFKVGHEVWEAGIGFDEAVHYFGGRSDGAAASEVDAMLEA